MFIDYSLYCRENLHEEDRKKLDKLCDIMEGVVEKAELQFFCLHENPGIFDSIRREIAKEAFSFVKESIGDTLQDSLVSVIDSYEEDIESVDEYTTYFYDEVHETFYKYEEEE